MNNEPGVEGALQTNLLKNSGFSPEVKTICGVCSTEDLFIVGLVRISVHIEVTGLFIGNSGIYLFLMCTMHIKFDKATLGTNKKTTHLGDVRKLKREDELSASSSLGKHPLCMWEEPVVQCS